MERDQFLNTMVLRELYSGTFDIPKLLILKILICFSFKRGCYFRLVVSLVFRY